MAQTTRAFHDMWRSQQTTNLSDTSFLASGEVQWSKLGQRATGPAAALFSQLEAYYQEPYGEERTAIPVVANAVVTSSSESSIDKLYGDLQDLSPADTDNREIVPSTIDSLKRILLDLKQEGENLNHRMVLLAIMSKFPNRKKPPLQFGIAAEKLLKYFDAFYKRQWSQEDKKLSKMDSEVSKKPQGKTRSLVIGDAFAQVATLSLESSVSEKIKVKEATKRQCLKPCAFCSCCHFNASCPSFGTRKARKDELI